MIICPKCSSCDVTPADEEHWPSCVECGFIEYDAETLALQAEILREQAYAKQILGYVPTFEEALRLGLTK
jgi:hypothetical protein